MRMEEKVKENVVSDGKSIRTLINLDGTEFESMDIGSSSQKNNVKEDCATRDAPGDVSFSSYLFRGKEFFPRNSSSASQMDMRRHSGDGTFPMENCRRVDNNNIKKVIGFETQRGISNGRHKGDRSQIMCRSMRVDRQSSFGKRVVVGGRHAKDGEIGIFDAERYFSSMHDEEKSSPQFGVSTSRREEMSRKGNLTTTRRPPHMAPRSLVSDTDVGETISRQSSSTASSMCSKAIQSDCQTIWSSRSGRLSHGITSLLNGPPLNQRLGTGPKVGTAKWKIACKCPCSNKKSIATNDSLLYQSGRIASIPTSLQSSHGSSPLRANCSGISTSNSDSMSREHYYMEKNTGLSINNDRDFANRSFTLKAGIEKGEELVTKSHGMPRMGKSLIEIRPTTTGSEDGIPVFNHKNQGEGFSFPIIGGPSTSPVVLDSKPRLSLQIIGSQGFSSRDDMRDSREQSPNTQRRPRMYSLDSKADNSSTAETRSSFSFPRISFCSQDSNDDRDLFFCKNVGGYNYNVMKLENNSIVEDDRSDSSSDLFEIESLSTDIFPCTQHHRRTNPGRAQLKDCNHNSTVKTQNGMDSEDMGQQGSLKPSPDGSIVCRAKQQQKHFMDSAEVARRSIRRSTTKDNPKDFSKPTRPPILLDSSTKERACHTISAPGSPSTGAQ